MKDYELKEHRFFNAASATKAEEYLDWLSADDRFWQLLKTFLMTPDTVKGAFEYELYDLCERLDEEARQSAQEEKRSQDDDDGPWEAA